ncbi:MAG: hypothetical protein AAGB22_10605 [Bacteroidota bacterium]
MRSFALTSMLLLSALPALAGTGNGGDVWLFYGFVLGILALVLLFTQVNKMIRQQWPVVKQRVLDWMEPPLNDAEEDAPHDPFEAGWAPASPGNA